MRISGFLLEQAMKPFVRNIIERDCIKASVDQTIAEVANILAKNKIGALPILDEKGDICGIVSERDIVKNLGNIDVDIKTDKITNIMTRSIISAPITVSSSELMEIMTVNRIRHVIIMDKDVLKGIVSIGDVVKRLLEKLEGEAEQLRIFINS